MTKSGEKHSKKTESDSQKKNRITMWHHYVKEVKYRKLCLEKLVRGNNETSGILEAQPKGVKKKKEK